MAPAGQTAAALPADTLVVTAHLNEWLLRFFALVQQQRECCMPSLNTWPVCSRAQPGLPAAGPAARHCCWLLVSICCVLSATPQLPHSLSDACCVSGSCCSSLLLLSSLSATPSFRSFAKLQIPCCSCCSIIRETVGPYLLKVVLIPLVYLSTTLVSQQ